MLFSIITPSYRQLDWLTLCAASVADQEVDLEHLVQDAGSPGIETWAQSHPRVKVTVEADDGMYDAINRGLRKASGEICAYLNCDEQYLPGTLQAVGDYFRQNPSVDVLFGDAILVDTNLKPLAYRTAIHPTRWHTLVRPLGVLTCSTFFRRKIIENGALFDPSWKIIGDKAWVLDLLNRGYQMAVFSQPLSLFAFTGTNLSQLPAALEEKARWDRLYPSTLRLAKPWIMAWHVLKKWRQGAYRNHSLSTAWYTPDSFSERCKYPELTLGGKWPSVSPTSTP